MRLFAPAPTLDPRAPYEALNDLLGLFTVEPGLRRLSFETHWRGWHDEHPPANPRMIFWVSAWVDGHDVQSPKGLAMAQTVERVLIDRGLMNEPDEGYNWHGRNTLVSTWTRKDVQNAWAKETKTPLGDPGRLALLRSQALLEYLNPAHITRDNLDHRRTTIVRRMDELGNAPEVAVEPPNVPSRSFLDLRRALHTLRAPPGAAGAEQGSPAIDPTHQEAQALQAVATGTPISQGTQSTARRPGLPRTR